MNEDYDYIDDRDDYTNHTLYCPNPKCPEILWGVYIHTEYDINVSYVSPEKDECCPGCGELGVDDNPHKEVEEDEN
jgi:hypothetical protein